MKRNISLATSLFAIAAAFSMNATAASDATADANAEASAQQPGAKKKVKSHSHMKEKLGVTTKAEPAPQAALDASTPAKKNPARDKSKHFHPRDGK
jgi:hypothetical protein